MRLTVGVVIFSGMIFSTFFTLYVIPTIYLLIGKNTKKPTQPANKILEIRIIKPATYLEPYLVLDSKLCICAI